MRALWLFLPILIAAPAAAATADAAAKAVALLEKVEAEWKPGCVSCHHQGLGMLALDTARRHGIAVDEVAAQAHAARTIAPMLTSVEGVLGAPVDVFAMGYGLLAAHAAGVAPNLVTAVLARRFANWQLPDGHWAASDARPPMSASEFTATALAVRTMQLYLPAAASAERAERFARARRWFVSAAPRSTEDRAFQVLGLVWSCAKAAERRSAVEGLGAAQRADGGWAQEAGMTSDAYATGEAVYALRMARVPADAAAVRRGIEFLLAAQRADGSWLVKSRLHSKAQISPPFFDAGFPGGRDQYISLAASAWAAMALMETMPDVAKRARPLPPAESAPRDAQPWMEKALFGPVEDVAALVDGGVEAQKLLPYVLPDAAKTALLLERGAKADARSVAVAATYREGAAAVRLLIAAGAKPGPEALLAASSSGDVEVAKALLESGAAADGRALMNAMFSDNAAMARLLVEHGARINDKDEHGMTPLIWAGLMHRTRVARVLLETGADASAVDEFGMTALQHTADIAGADPETARVLRGAAGVARK